MGIISEKVNDMRDYKDCPVTKIELDRSIVRMLFVFFIILIAALFLLDLQSRTARSECVQAAIDASYTPEQTAQLCNVVK
jgi:hypothetical protein